MTDDRRDRDHPATGRPGEIAAEPTIVNDLGINPANEPISLYGASSRDGVPLEVTLTASGERVTVVPAGEPWQPIPGAGSGLAQRLWVGRAGARPAGDAWRR